MRNSFRPARLRSIGVVYALALTHFVLSAPATAVPDRGGELSAGWVPQSRVVTAPTRAPRPCRLRRRCDRIPPVVTISDPAPGELVVGSVLITGTSSDNQIVSTVSVSLDGGPHLPAVGTTSWTFLLETTPLSPGSHAITARAMDLAGNVGSASLTVQVPATEPGSAPPLAGGYFQLAPAGSWSALPSGQACRGQVRYSTWEPRPDNYKRNHVMPDPAAVRVSLGARPRAREGAYDSRWDTWLLARVDGQFTGTTDEILQWAACKWGLPDDLLRAIAVRESTWFQYQTYPSGRCVLNFGCGDMFTTASPSSVAYCDAVAGHGYDYQKDFGSGICPKTFSIVGLMDWQDPAWGAYPDNQNGTFPFNRDSTAFAVDYLGSELRGCLEGWKWWLKDTGTRNYAAGDIWGCVGAWYAGDWHSSAADGYVSRVQDEMAHTRWLDPTWPADGPGCSAYGCPGPDPL